MLSYLMTQGRRGWAIVCAVILAIGLFDVALSAVSVTDVVEAFRYTYGAQKIAYLAALEIVAWRILTKRKVEMGGRGQHIVPIQLRNTGVFRGHAEGGAKTTRRAQPDTTEATFSLQEFHGIFNVSWKMLRAASRSEWAFQKALDFIENSFRRRVMRYLNAEILGTGRGELAVLPGADDQTTVTVAELPLCDIGSIVDVMDDSDNDTKLASAVTVTDIDEQNRTVTLSGAPAGTAAGDYLTVADSVSVNTGSLHMAGLGAWISNANPSSVVGNLGGIDRSAAGNRFWQSLVMTNPAGAGTNRPFTEDLMLEAMDTTRERGGKMITDIMSNLRILRKYHEYLREDQYFATSQIKELSGGVGLGRDESGMKRGEDSEGETIYRFSGIEWRAEMFSRANRVKAFNREDFYLAHDGNELPRPISEIFDGQVEYFTQTANTDFEVVSYWEGELISENPMSAVDIRDIAES